MVYICARIGCTLHRHNSIYIDVGWIYMQRMKILKYKRLYSDPSYRTDERFSIFILSVSISSPIMNTKKYSALGNSCAHTLLHPLIFIKNAKWTNIWSFCTANEFPISIFNSLIHRTDYLMNWNSSLLNCIPSDKIWYLIIACESKIQPSSKTERREIHKLLLLFCTANIAAGRRRKKRSVESSKISLSI